MKLQNPKGVLLADAQNRWSCPCQSRLCPKQKRAVGLNIFRSYAMGILWVWSRIS